QPWPAVQMDAYRRGVAAILKHIGQDASWCCGHKEYALPVGRKPDPSFDMDKFRTEVSAIMGGTVPTPPPIPKQDASGRPTLRRSSQGDLIRVVQKKIGIPISDIDGKFGPNTEAAVRRFQSNHGIVPDGIVGPKTWEKLDTVG
ncbi:partial zinc D-Ala-D-Ala carboxypeptidase, partial [Patescibacteria group bacterium]